MRWRFPLLWNSKRLQPSGLAFFWSAIYKIGNRQIPASRDTQHLLCRLQSVSSRLVTAGVSLMERSHSAGLRGMRLQVRLHSSPPSGMERTTAAREAPKSIRQREPNPTLTFHCSELPCYSAATQKDQTHKYCLFWDWWKTNSQLKSGSALLVRLYPHTGFFPALLWVCLSVQGET